jgi:hypothetical protein
VKEIVAQRYCVDELDGTAANQPIKIRFETRTRKHRQVEAIIEQIESEESKSPIA